MADSGVTPKDIYLALTHAGASTIQAIGIMANMMNESTLNPEAVNPAGPQSGVGLVQWQTTDYPGAANLVTGNPRADMEAQVKFLAMTGGFKAAQGTNAGQAAGNFAANYEKCSTCQPGGQQFQARVQNTLTIAGWIASGHWPHATANPHAVGDLSQTGTSPSSTPDCAWQVNLNIPLIGGNICLVTKSELRGMAGIALMGAAGLVGFAGLAVLLAVAGMKAAAPLGKAAEGVGGALLLVPGAEGAGAALAGAGRAARNPARAGRQREARGAREDAELERRMGSGPSRENKDLRVGRGAIRETPAETRRRKAASRSRARGSVSTGQKPATRAEAGF